MTISVAINVLLIVVARITDVSLDTLRTAAIIQGRRAFAALLGFFESVVYISVVAKVLLNISHPVYALAYGVGFAAGTYLGIVIEQRLAFGDQVVSLFTRNGLTLSKALQNTGYRLAEVDAHLRDGDLRILIVEIARKHADSLLRDIASLDPSCFCVINDVRLAKWLGESIATHAHGRLTCDFTCLFEAIRELMLARIESERFGWTLVSIAREIGLKLLCIAPVVGHSTPTAIPGGNKYRGNPRPR